MTSTNPTQVQWYGIWFLTFIQKPHPDQFSSPSSTHHCFAVTCNELRNILPRQLLLEYTKRKLSRSQSGWVGKVSAHPSFEPDLYFLRELCRNEFASIAVSYRPLSRTVIDIKCEFWMGTVHQFYNKLHCTLQKASQENLISFWSSSKPDVLHGAITIVCYPICDTALWNTYK